MSLLMLALLFLPPMMMGLGIYFTIKGPQTIGVPLLACLAGFLVSEAYAYIYNRLRTNIFLFPF